jgi:hypothetical protein
MTIDPPRITTSSDASARARARRGFSKACARRRPRRQGFFNHSSANLADGGEGPARGERAAAKQRAGGIVVGEGDGPPCLA